MLHVTATGLNTNWGVENPFSIVSGPATDLENYENNSATSAEFDITVTALTGNIIIGDSDSGDERIISARASAKIMRQIMSNIMRPLMDSPI